MRPNVRASLVLVLSAWTAGAAAAPVDPNAPLPAGHPPLDSPPPPAATSGALPPGHPPLAPAAPAPSGALPAGHPPTGSQGTTAAAPPPPHAVPREPPKDRVAAAPDLPPGTVEVLVQDGNSAPLPGTHVRLGILRQEVAEGDSHQQRDGVADGSGIVRFDALPRGTSYSYRAIVEAGPASYSTTPFRLDETAGQRAVLHVFPVTRDLGAALIGSRGVVFIQPREDVFAIEVNFRILNVGDAAWVPENVTLSLPAGAKAFRASESMKDTRVESAGPGDLRLLGTFSPGEHEIGFQFQLENTHSRSKEFEVPLLPRAFEMRVFAERARTMTLEVEGFPETEPVAGDNGTPLLGTARRLARGEAPLTALSVRLDDLPVPSNGRWYAALLSTLLMAAGLFQLARRRSSGPTKSEISAAESLIFDELVELERLRQREGVGPRTYQQARTELLDALARLGARQS